MKRSITAISIITAALLLAGCATVGATQSQARELPWEGFAYAPRDWAASELPQGAVRIAAEQQEKAAQEEAEAQSDDEVYYEEYYAPAYYSAWAGAGDGFMQEGVREYDGRTESWYSSNQAYHNDIAQWTVDDEGYYRDDEGRYVVAASDMDYGTVFETSKGEAIVLDDGASPGVTDFYTAF